MNSHPVRSKRAKLAQAVIAGLLAVLALAPDADATVIGFDLNIAAISGNSNFGTGVSSGQSFTGIMYFNDTDILADGTAGQRSSPLPGGDMLTIAGVDYGPHLNQLIWKFRGNRPRPNAWATRATTDAVRETGSTWWLAVYN